MSKDDTDRVASIGKHWISTPGAGGWEKNDRVWPLHPNHYRTPYTDGPDLLDRHMVLVARFSNPVVHDPAPSPTLDEPAVTG